MTITNTNLASNIIKTFHSNVGVIYFFNHVAIIEINDGSHIDLSSARQTIHQLIEYFGQSRPFGLIANRVNSYSIALLDIVEIKAVFPNLAAYGVVSYNNAGKMNANIENSFCKSQTICFNDLYECTDAVYQRVKESIQISLN